VKYSKLVPTDSFIGQYMEYMSVIETPYVYDFWCALWAIGTGVGREVFVDRPNAPVYLNWYVILAAESGTTRKSTAVRSIRNVFGEHTGGPESDCKYHIITGNTSPISLELALHERSRRTGTADAIIVVSELTRILGKEGYMTTMPGLLADLYDCDSHLSPGTQKHGEITLNKVFVSFLSASTPAWLVTAINPAVIEGGFTSRVIFVVEDARKKSIAWPEVRSSDSLESIRGKFHDTITQHKEPIRISTGGLKRFTHWYRSRTSHGDPFLSSFEAREDDHVLRCAACLAINDGTWEIQSGHIGTACKVITESKTRARSLFGGDFSTRARIGAAVARVREILIDAGGDGIKHSDLQRRIVRRLDIIELRLLIRVLHESGMIQIFKVGRGTFYRATRAIESLGVVSRVLSRLNLPSEH
jgi:hypothetical protein